MPETGHKIAIASRDGKLVYHFGQADRFLIYEIAQGAAKYLDTRTTEPACANEPQEKSHDHQIAATAVMLADCRAVLVTRIGPGAECILKERGIQPIAGPTFVKEALQQYLSTLAKD